MAISSGDKVKGKLSAAFFNRTDLTNEWYQRNKALGEGGSAQPTPTNNVTVLIRNNTGVDLRRGEVVELDGSLLTAPDPRVLSFSGVEPDLTHVGWGITLQQIPDESMDDVLCLGVCIAFVNILDETHEYADRASGEIVLQSAAKGPVKILHKPTGGTPPEERECVVQIMDEVEVQVKYIRYDHLPAAYGGPGTLGISGSAATTNGNISPTDRQIFPKLWQNAYSINSSGDLEANTETGYCVNLSSLPLLTGWAVATKLPSKHPDFGDVWAVLPNTPSHQTSANFSWLTEESSGDWTIDDGDAFLVRGSGTGLNSSGRTSWCFPYGGDVMLSHVGWWKVTFGYTGYISSYAWIDHTSGAQSAGTAHTHVYKQPAGCEVKFGIHRNFNPGTTTLGSIATPAYGHTDWEMKNYHPGPDLTLGSARRKTFEKTCFIETDFAPWHGQHHTRLSLYIQPTFETYTDNAANPDPPQFKLQRAWMSIEPARYVTTTTTTIQNIDKVGCGANQYPGGYSGGSGTFVWYGGGSAPIFIDKDGVTI